MAATPAALHALPDELIEEILHYLAPEDVLNLELTSKRFSAPTNDKLLWRYLCRNQYNFWSPRHRFYDLLQKPASAVDWKNLLAERQLTNQSVNRMFEGVLSGQQARYSRMMKIANMGYDAKEALIKHCLVGEDAEDVLSRRWYGSATLGTIHRVIATELWARLAKGEDIPLDLALGGFDMFVLKTIKGDLGDTQRHLDELAERFKKECPEQSELPPRQKAIKLVSFLRQHNYVGVDREDQINDLQTCFLGIALVDPAHSALPLISVAIFCGIARRIGLDAAPCGMPFHVFAIVSSAPGYTLDGIASEGQRELMYLDPFNQEKEITAAQMRYQLTIGGHHASTHDEYLAPATTKEMLFRTARNILTRSQTIHRRMMREAQTAFEDQESAEPSTIPDLDSAIYAAMWATMFFGDLPMGPGGHIARRIFLPQLLDLLQTKFPMDADLVEEYVIPLFDHEQRPLREIIDSMRASDAIAPTPVSRDDAAVNVEFRVGQLFKHKRYHYIGLITGWDPKCAAEEEWMRQMQVDRLPKGRAQSFYHSLIEDRTVRYVAQENIEIIHDQPPHSIWTMAGRYFKRWDKEKGEFVSNIKDQYPDD